MSKRFIDTELFNDSWFMDLSIHGKLLWVYCLTNCDHAGIIEWNKKLIKFQTGIEDLETVTKELCKSLVIVNDHVMFLPKFFEYQYPNYPRKRFAAADGAVKILLRYDLLKKISVTLTEDFIKSLSIGIGIGIGKKGGVGGKQTTGTNLNAGQDRAEPLPPRSPSAVPISTDMAERLKKSMDNVGKE